MKKQSLVISLKNNNLLKIKSMNRLGLLVVICLLLSMNLNGHVPVDETLQSHVDLRNSSEKWANPIELSGKWDFYWN